MLITDQASPHFSVDELVRGSGIPDDPALQANLLLLATTLLEPARQDWAQHIQDNNLGGSPIWIVIDGYRSPARNAEVGGAGQSKHMICQAADVAPDVDWRALRDGRGSERDARRMQDFVTWFQRWVVGERGKACGGYGIYSEIQTGQLYWLHLDIRPRVNGHITIWTGHHVGSEQ